MVYGFAPLFSALLNASGPLLATAAGLGVVIQAVRAKRAAILLSSRREVRTSDTFNAMVVGHGIGNLVPIAPCGVALRCFLTERLSSVSIAYSAGVFMLEGVLDGLGPALLTGFLLLALQLPNWLRFLLIATLCQSLLSFTVPVVAHAIRRSGKLSAMPGWIARFLALGGDVADGLESGLSRSMRSRFSIAGISLLITALCGLQLVLFLTAFGLTTSTSNVLLILVLTLVAGNLPINLPGSGTVATAAVLQVAGIHGAGVAGFVMMSRAVPSSESILLACGGLAWWGVTGRVHDLRVGAVLQSLHQVWWQAALGRGRSIGYRLGSVVSIPIGRLSPNGLSRRGLISAVGLLGIVALTAPVSNLLTAHESVSASMSIRYSISVATTAGSVLGDGTQDALSHSFRGVSDLVRDA
jgi:uncharacterized protein (TIRG00374 family)